MLIEHALTGDSHAAGPAGPGHVTPGWWDPLIGPGAAIDTDRWWVICPNTLGGCQGTTGPASASTRRIAMGLAVPVMTIRDQVAVEAAFADALGIDQWAAVVGGSMGGMRALEWAVTYPERVARLVVLAGGAAATAEQIALCAVQAQAIRLDPGFRGGDYYDAPPGQGPELGLGLARRIGQISYRCEPELQTRFGRQPQSRRRAADRCGRYAVESYLDHQAEKLVHRFDANSYLVLSRAMDHHDVGRDRGGIGRGAAPGPGHRHGDRRGQRPPVPLAAAAGAGVAPARTARGGPGAVTARPRRLPDRVRAGRRIGRRRPRPLKRPGEGAGPVAMGSAPR